MIQSDSLIKLYSFWGEPRNQELETRVEQRTQELAEAERRYRMLFESAHDAIVVVNQQGEITMINPRVETMLGYLPNELIGQKIEVLVPEKLRAQHVNYREHYLSEPTPRMMGAGLDLYAQKKDGTLLPVDIALGASHAEKGHMAVSAVIRDMKERKTNENQQAFLAKMGQVLTETLDLEMRMQNAADLLAEFVCDWASIDLLNEAGEFTRFGVSGGSKFDSHVLEKLKKAQHPKVILNSILKTVKEKKINSVAQVDEEEVKREFASNPDFQVVTEKIVPRSFFGLTHGGSRSSIRCHYIDIKLSRFRRSC